MDSYVRDLKFYLERTGDEGPPLDLYETDDLLVFEFDLPGIDTEEVDVEVLDDLLVIEGSRRDAETDKKGMRYICMERYRNYFRREVKIPVSVNALQGKAVYNQGVLKIAFPKVHEHSIKIRIEKKEDS